MKEVLQQKIIKGMSDEQKTNVIREFLQILILKIMFDRNVFENLAFVGGTALRILYGLRRFSEDLDFSLVNKEKYSFSELLKILTYELKLNNLEFEFKSNENNIVHSSLIKFPGLLADMGLKVHPKQKLSIKLEIDTNPPLGGISQQQPVTESFVFTVNTFDLSSLYATKLHACFFRTYTKGRDFYDLLWYLGKKIEPNYILLNNAIRQTQKKDYNIGSENIKQFIRDKLEKVDFNLIQRDVERFLEDKNELKMLDREVMINLL